ncbi:MAG: hypothetical protein HY918_03060 [Candidatus Doudnabacteria bacterium]|nr:hypothetical protein [Candidatus Doudnabacteria bacterium]
MSEFICIAFAMVLVSILIMALIDLEFLVEVIRDSPITKTITTVVMGLIAVAAVCISYWWHSFSWPMETWARMMSPRRKGG